MSMENIIEVKNVSKSFGGVKANIDISLNVKNFIKDIPLNTPNSITSPGIFNIFL